MGAIGWVKRKVVKGAKKAGGAIVDAGEAVADAVDPAKQVARAADEIVDTFKDDELILDGESRLVVFGVEIGRLSHVMRVHVADKE